VSKSISCDSFASKSRGSVRLSAPGMVTFYLFTYMMPSAIDGGKGQLIDSPDDNEISPSRTRL
jgi:hypothetical protein